MNRVVADADPLHYLILIEKDLIQLPEALAKLRATNFFVSEELLAAALARDRARKKA